MEIFLHSNLGATEAGRPNISSFSYDTKPLVPPPVKRLPRDSRRVAARSKGDERPSFRHSPSFDRRYQGSPDTSPLKRSGDGNIVQLEGVLPLFQGHEPDDLSLYLGDEYSLRRNAELFPRSREAFFAGERTLFDGPAKSSAFFLGGAAVGAMNERA